jgi:hypothetical protein
VLGVGCDQLSPLETDNVSAEHQFPTLECEP